MPPIAIVSTPGFDLAKAISSCRFRAGTLGLPTSKLGTVEIIAIGVKSATGSNGSFGQSVALIVWLVKLTSLQH